jgi:glycerol dehydrogenase-like iron-containing ADH family enzyme
VFGSVLDWDTLSNMTEVYVVFLSQSRKIPSYYPDSTMAFSFHMISTLLFTNNSNIQLRVHEIADSAIQHLLKYNIKHGYTVVL